MEYGLYISSIRELPEDPRSLCAGEWRSLLPAAPLKALYFGSEFCSDLLPEAAWAERAFHQADEAGVEAVLLTPVVTSEALTRVDRLLCSLVERCCSPAVVCNDWGVLQLLREKYPHLKRRTGRLMNRGLRDPRLTEYPASEAPETMKPSNRVRSLLLKLGVEAIESDADLQGVYLGEAQSGLQRTLHFPYVFAATGRNCLVKADGASSSEECFTKGLGVACPGRCRSRFHQIERSDTGQPLWRSGNTIFYGISSASARLQLANSDRVVLYERPVA